jgi:hypothetical protein
MTDAPARNPRPDATSVRRPLVMRSVLSANPGKWADHRSSPVSNRFLVCPASIGTRKRSLEWIGCERGCLDPSARQIAQFGTSRDGSAGLFRPPARSTPFPVCPGSFLARSRAAEPNGGERRARERVWRFLVRDYAGKRGAVAITEIQRCGPWPPRGPNLSRTSTQSKFRISESAAGLSSMRDSPAGPPVPGKR